VLRSTAQLLLSNGRVTANAEVEMMLEIGCCELFGSIVYVNLMFIGPCIIVIAEE
jgi:hypothetical protein